MKKYSLNRILIMMCVGVSCMQQVEASTESAWVHPGVYVGQQQLDFIKEQVDARVEPYYTMYQKALASNFGKKNYQVKGPVASGYSQCGSGSKPDIGCEFANSDSATAYLQAVLWVITGDKTYADNSIKILNAYAQKFKGYVGYTAGGPACPGSESVCHNGKLQAAWDAEKWPRAAEIIRYANGGSAGWPTADAEAFGAMLQKVFVPLLKDGASNNGNWELSMSEGLMGIAVYTEDLNLLRLAQKLWSERVHAYYYNQPQDGNQQPPFPPNRAYEGAWNGQLIFGPSTNGVMQETCRDLRHAEMGLAATLNAAETDYLQGGTLTANLYSADGAQERIITAMNLMAGFELNNTTSAPKDFCTGAGKKLKPGSNPTFVIGYNHYHNRLHDPNMADETGTSGMYGTANTHKWIEKGIMPQKFDYDYGGHMAILEPLTHYGSPIQTEPSFGLSVVPNTQIVLPGAVVNYTINAKANGGYNQNVALTIKNALPAGTSATFSPDQITSGSGSSIVTVTTSSTTPSGINTLVFAGTDGTVEKSTSATLVVAASDKIVTITARNRSMKVGDKLPTLKYTESPDIKLSKKPSCSTTATRKSPVGQYPIKCAGAEAPDYFFTYVDGVLSIKQS